MPATLPNAPTIYAGNTGAGIFRSSRDATESSKDEKVDATRSRNSSSTKSTGSLKSCLKSANSSAGGKKPEQQSRRSPSPSVSFSCPSDDEVVPDGMTFDHVQPHWYPERRDDMTLLSLPEVDEDESQAMMHDRSSPQVNDYDHDSPVWHSWHSWGNKPSTSREPIADSGMQMPVLTNVARAYRIHETSFQDPAEAFAGAAMNVADDCVATAGAYSRVPLPIGGLGLLEQSEKRVREAVFIHAEGGSEVARRCYEKGYVAGQIGFTDLAINLAMLRERGADSITCEKLEKRLCALLLHDRLAERSGFATWYHNNSCNKVKALREAIHDVLEGLSGKGDNYDHVVRSIVLPAVQQQVEERIGPLLPESLEVLRSSHPLLTAAARQAITCMCNTLREQGRGCALNNDHAKANIWRLAHHTAELMRELVASGEMPPRPHPANSRQDLHAPGETSQRPGAESSPRPVKPSRPASLACPQRNESKDAPARVDQDVMSRRDGTGTGVPVASENVTHRPQSRESGNSQVFNQNFEFNYGPSASQADQQLRATRQKLEIELPPLRSSGLVAAVQRTSKHRLSSGDFTRTTTNYLPVDSVEAAQGPAAADRKGVASQAGQAASGPPVIEKSVTAPLDPQEPVSRVQLRAAQRAARLQQGGATVDRSDVIEPEHIKDKIISPLALTTPLEKSQFRRQEPLAKELLHQADGGQSPKLPAWMSEIAQSSYHEAYEKRFPKGADHVTRRGNWIKTDSGWRRETEDKPVILSMPNIGLDLMSRLPIRPMSEVIQFVRPESYPPSPPLWKVKRLQRFPPEWEREAIESTYL